MSNPFFAVFLKFPARSDFHPSFLIICSFDACCVQGILVIRRQIHISKASRLLISSYLNVQVSLPYKTTLQTRTLTILFFNPKINDPLCNSFLLLKAVLPKAIFLRTSLVQRPSSVTKLPKYTNYKLFNLVQLVTFNLHCQQPNPNTIQ